MTDTKQASLIEKIKKLFAIANRRTGNDGTTNEAEATAAMNLAQELLAKYNLDMAVIKDSAEAGQQEAAGGKREQVKVNRSAMYNWQQQLWKAIAEANFCFHWVTVVSEEHPKRKGYFRRVKRHVILGSTANVTVAQMMGEYLAETIERLIPYTGAQRLSNSGISWREGCATRLIERIEEKVEAMKRNGMTVENAACTALAVQDLHEKEYAANYDARYGQGAYARMKKSEADYEAGRAERERKQADLRKREEEERARTLAGETPKQRAAREQQEFKAAAKSAAADARWWERQRRKQRREESRRDIAAYARGFKKGGEISLDAQVSGGSKKGELA